MPPNAAFCSALRRGAGYNSEQETGTSRERAMAEQSPSAVPAAKTSEDRLDSWKEIAAYLNRDVTTVQRWEKREGMPVYRHVHDKRGSVYAISQELDAWRENRRPVEEEQPEVMG